MEETKKKLSDYIDCHKINNNTGYEHNISVNYFLKKAGVSETEITNIIKEKYNKIKATKDWSFVDWNDRLIMRVEETKDDNLFVYEMFFDFKTFVKENQKVQIQP